MYVLLSLLLALGSGFGASYQPVSSDATVAEANKMPACGTEAKIVKEIAGLTFYVMIVDLNCSEVRFYHKDENGKVFGSISNLRGHIENVEKRSPKFITNGGMFEANFTPTGLYIEEGKVRYKLNLSKGGTQFSNFYSLEPNGVFYLDRDGRAGIVERETFKALQDKAIFATQSAPILFTGLKKRNPILNKQSKNKFVRSGVGIKANTDGKKLVFALSAHPMNFFDFSRIFDFYGCNKAMYLDGGVSEAYLPQHIKVKTKNKFATMIAVFDKQK